MTHQPFRVDPAVAALALGVGAATWLLHAGAWALAAGAATAATGLVAAPLAGWVARYRKLPPAGSPERTLVVRARSAVTTARRLTRSAPRGPIVERFRAAEIQLEASADGIARLARQSIAVRRLAAGIDAGAAGRLNQLTLEFAERAELLVGSLESVVAGLIEVLATAAVDPSGEALAALERLGTEVQALQAGLEEAQGLGRRMALNAVSEISEVER